MSEKSPIEAETDKIVKLDEKDKKILYLLSVDAKQPAVKIAKDIGLSKDAVIYRINRLVKSGVIMYFIPIIDAQKFGIYGYYLYLELENLQEDTDKEILNYLKASKNTMFVGSCFGGYDIITQIFVRDIHELEEFMNGLRGRYDEYIRNYALLVTAKEHKYPAKYLVGSKGLEIHRPERKKSEENVVVDQKDIQILRILSLDTKTPTHKIASELDLSSDAVLYRIKRLVAAGIIERFIAVIDVTKLGYRWQTILLRLKGLSPEKEKMLLGFIKNHPNMLYLVRAIGEYDLAIDVCAKNEEHFNDIMMELRIKFHDIIKSEDTILMFEEYKYTYFPEVLWAESQTSNSAKK